MSDGFVVLMGIGTVFVGLITLVILCSIMGSVCSKLIPAYDIEENKADNTSNAYNAGEENRGEIIAAVTCAIAEELGTDVSGIRVLSFKRV